MSEWVPYVQEIWGYLSTLAGKFLVAPLNLVVVFWVVGSVLSLVGGVLFGGMQGGMQRSGGSGGGWLREWLMALKDARATAHVRTSRRFDVRDWVKYAKLRLRYPVR